ncbi:sensor histidine kinase [Microbulbifer yueqingensis]|uniref:histidine kinase n=1 Tax=Microbulbifer yueqingensis TaxID=658219 RepID=A0A1G9EWC4_9GAMM|nr:ATP-binding protein [Microbulbifer yueqingensis]SDK80472.1 Sensor protein PilS [Microbulbifer yueqingensis]
MTTAVTSPRRQAFQYHELLRVYGWYRVAIALVLLGLFTSELGQGALGNTAPGLFLNTVIAYTALNVGWLLHLHATGYQVRVGQLSLMLGADIPAFLAMIHASGGLNSGLGYLLLISCAAGSLLLERRLGAFFAAVASTAVIAQQVYGLIAGTADSRDIVSAGSLGILLFGVVSGLQYLSGLLRVATWRADQQSRQAAHLQRLAQQIIERMRTGVVVLNDAHQTELVNQAAQQMTGRQVQPGSRLYEALLSALRNWKKDPNCNGHLMRLEDGNELRVSFASLHREQGNNTLVFIEDNRKLTQAAQKLKLASLGHLTGSIAHEVRNPLGAISHAAQLLSESTSLGQEDRHLAEIICRHSDRVNQIVENVMLLSRRQAPQPQLHELGCWIEQFVAEYRIGAPAGTVISLELPETPLHARFDGAQLLQVLTNLCNNALSHSEMATGVPEFELYAHRHPERDTAVLDVVDLGPGVPEEYREKIFEPFFTTGQGGSGLGLYIARELCESNQASLSHCRDTSGRSCFRIEFAHANRVL